MREIQNQRNTDFKKLSHIPLGNVINRIDTGALPLSSTPSAIIFSVGCHANALELNRISTFATHAPVALSHCRTNKRKHENIRKRDSGIEREIKRKREKESERGRGRKRAREEGRLSERERDMKREREIERERERKRERVHDIFIYNIYIYVYIYTYIYIHT